MLMDGWTDWTYILETFYIEIRNILNLFQPYF